MLVSYIFSKHHTARIQPGPLERLCYCSHLETKSLQNRKGSFDFPLQLFRLYSSTLDDFQLLILEKEKKKKRWFLFVIPHGHSVLWLQRKWPRWGSFDIPKLGLHIQLETVGFLGDTCISQPVSLWWKVFYQGSQEPLSHCYLNMFNSWDWRWKREKKVFLNSTQETVRSLCLSGCMYVCFFIQTVLPKLICKWALFNGLKRKLELTNKIFLNAI